MAPFPIKGVETATAVCREADAPLETVKRSDPAKGFKGLPKSSGLKETNDVTTLTEHRPAQSLRGAGPLLFVIAMAGAIALYWAGLESLFQVWQTPEYSHGPVIPFLSLFLFLRDMKAVPPPSQTPTDRWQGLFVVAMAVAVGLFGNLVRIPDIVTYGLILWIWGMVLVAFGFRRGRKLWHGVLHLVFMLPLPNVLYWKMNIYLQYVASVIGTDIVGLVGIPVYLDGNIIDLGIYKLQVAEACSGLRYLFPIMSFSYIFSVLYMGPKWHKIVIFVSAAPIAVFMNSIRIGVIGILVEYYGIEQAEGFLHAFEGWVIFVACILLLFMLAIFLQWLSSNPRPLVDVLDIDFGGFGSQLRRFFSLSVSKAALWSAFLVVSAAALWQFAPTREAAQMARQPLALFPSKLGGWAGGPHNKLESRIERVLRADDYLSAGFENQREAEPVHLFVAWYNKQTEGSGIHSPEVCIPVGGWEVSKWEQRAVKLPGDDGRFVYVNRAIIRKGTVRQLVYYWFEQRGRKLTSDYLVKAYTVWDSLARGRSDGALVRLTTHISATERMSAADKRLGRFLAAVSGTLPRFVPN